MVIRSFESVAKFVLHETSFLNINYCMSFIVSCSRLSTRVCLSIIWTLHHK